MTTSTDEPPFDHPSLDSQLRDLRLVTLMHVMPFTKEKVWDTKILHVSAVEKYVALLLEDTELMWTVAVVRVQAPKRIGSSEAPGHVGMPVEWDSSVAHYVRPDRQTREWPIYELETSLKAAIPGVSVVIGVSSGMPILHVCDLRIRSLGDLFRIEEMVESEGSLQAGKLLGESTSCGYVVQFVKSRIEEISRAALR